MHLPHLHRWDKGRLEKILGKFVGREAQFLMETKEGLVFRGEISDCLVPNDRNKRVFVYFNWLTERRFVPDEGGKQKLKWFLQDSPPGGSPLLDVGFAYYYSQPDEDRLKMKGDRGEVCHFFKKEDHTNLVRCGDEFTPYYLLHQRWLWQAVLAHLFPKRQAMPVKESGNLSLPSLNAKPAT